MARFVGTTGDDNFSGTAGEDMFKLHRGGDDIAFGDAARDRFVLGGALTGADSLDGGSSKDWLILEGDYTAGIVFGATTITNIEVIKLTEAFGYDLTFHDGNIAAGGKLVIDANAVFGANGITINAEAEQDGDTRLVVVATAQADTLIGGKGRDLFESGLESDTLNGNGGKDLLVGGPGGDFLTGGAGADTFAYFTSSASTGLDHDFLLDFNADADLIDVQGNVTAVSTDSGTINSASFDADLASEANDWTGAKVFTVTGGDLIGQVLLLLDRNGSNSYEVGTDYVIDITGLTGTIDTSDFI
jgi:Ca2+-binding RTX toxin-like protein